MNEAASINVVRR